MKSQSSISTGDQSGLKHQAIQDMPLFCIIDDRSRQESNPNCKASAARESNFGKKLLNSLGNQKEERVPENENVLQRMFHARGQG